MKPDMNGRENGDGRDAGPGDAPKGAPSGLGKRQRFLCMLSPPFFRLLSISVQGNGVWRRVSNGAGGVLLASMGGMLGQATRQKEGAPSGLGKRQRFFCVLSPSFLSFVEHFCARECGM